MQLRGILLGTGLLLGAGAVFFAQQKELPAPFATPSANNRPRVIPQPQGAKLDVPAGFQIEIWHEGFKVPRFMMLGPNNEILLSDSADAPDGSVYVLQGKERKQLITGLHRPYGLALHEGWLYVGEPESIKRYKYDSKAMTAGPGQEVVALKGNPNFSRGHWTRSILFANDGSRFCVGVGSGSNVDAGEDPRRAAIDCYNPDGSGHEIYASGTRNPIGLRWYPGTNSLWAAVQERDALGDDLVPDYFTHIQKGGFYGWPYAYAGPHEDPRRKGERPDLVAKTIQGDVLLGSHVAVLDFIFYTGKQFPKEYQGGAFLAFHGSWNRSMRVGQSVAFIPFKDAKPSGPITEVVKGWMLGPDKRDVWGRPVGLLQLPDGSLLISDDGNNRIWHLSYKG
ncbi:MAG TPA: PQQ-dependent sugar dehydrogenase [Candidatus Acidoferrales bacterium]|nr:PQQ-dependent sugar dehydrogenase [Candidatus Acidoferrales bacterium]